MTRHTPVATWLVIALMASLPHAETFGGNIGPPHPPDVWEPLYDEAAARFGERCYDESIAVQRTALAAALQLYGEKDHRCWRSWLGIAVAYQRTGRYEEALEILDRVDRLMGPNRAMDVTADCHAQRGYIHRIFGRWQKSLSSYERAVAIYEQLGSATVQTKRYADALLFEAEALVHLGDGAAAEQVLRKAFRVGLRAYEIRGVEGPAAPHLWLAEVVRLMGDSHLVRGEPGLAGRYLNLLLPIYSKVGAYTNEELVEGLTTMGLWQLDGGEVDEVRRSCREGLQILEGLPAVSGDPVNVQTLERLGRLAVLAGELGIAEACFTRAKAGVSNAPAWRLMLELDEARLLLARRNLDGALVKAREVANRAGGEDVQLTRVDAMLLVAAAQVSGRRFEEALHSLEEARGVLEPIAEHQVMRDALFYELLVEALRGLGRTDEAEEIEFERGVAPPASVRS